MHNYHKILSLPANVPQMEHQICDTLCTSDLCNCKYLFNMFDISNVSFRRHSPKYCKELQYYLMLFLFYALLKANIPHAKYLLKAPTYILFWDLDHFYAVCIQLLKNTC